MSSPACATPHGLVVGADVTGAVAGGRIAILGEDERLLGGVVDHLGLIGGIDGAHGDAVHAFCQKIVNDTLLLSGGGLRGDYEIDGNGRTQVFLGLLSTTAIDSPEFGGVVGEESEVEGLIAAAAAGGGGGVTGFITA